MGRAGYLAYQEARALRDADVNVYAFPGVSSQCIVHPATHQRQRYARERFAREISGLV